MSPPPPPLLNTQHSPNTPHKRWQIGGGMLMRGLTGRGRRAYLIVATLLFLLSMSLLILKSWATPRLPPILPDVGFTRGFSQQAAYHSRPLFSQKEWDNLIQEETQRGLVWFVQVSDVHLQRGADAKKEINHFRQFVDDTLSYIQPAAVLVTGDLTNSKTFGLKLSELPQEWLIYQRTVRDRVTRANSTLWLDLPGNHDNFDEVQHAHFRAYAVQPDIGATRVVSGGIGRPNITLLPLDASLKPGIRAFNFLGHLTLQHRQQLEKAVRHAAESGDVLLSYGHYPTNSIVSGGEEREVLAGSAAYLCGHLHAGLGLVNTMWTTHPSGMAEIELADWAHRHRYRILAIDGGKVVWLDVAHPTWPIVLLTALSHHQRTSTSLTFVIRLLVFSNEPISSVSLRVDDELGHWTDCQYNLGSLYTATLFLAPSTAPPTQADFIKALQVLVLHTSGSKSLLRVGMPGVGFEHPRPTLIAPLLLSIKLHSLELIPVAHFFNLEYPSSDALLLKGMLFYLFFMFGGGIAEQFLMSYLSGLVVCGLLLLLGKYLGCFDHLLPSRLLAATSSIADNNTLFSLLFIFLFYPLIGPWYLGPLAQEQLGIVFMWGIFVDSTYLPGELTYPDAFFLGITLQFPGFIAVLLKKMLRCGTPRPQCLGWVKVMVGVTFGVQVVAVLSWLVLDSLFLNGPLRLFLSLLLLAAWRRI